MSSISRNRGNNNNFEAAEAKTMAEKYYSRCSQAWEALFLVSNHLDAKTIARASCVCKSWFVYMSSDEIWQPICDDLYPSLSNLRKTYATLSYHQLYALGYLSEKRRLQIQKPPKPRICLENLLFSIDIYRSKTCLLTIVKPCAELCVDKNSVFRFDIDFNDENNIIGIEALEDMRITWNVVLSGFKRGFTMMDCKGKANFVLGLEGWFSKELPSSGCCSSSAASGLVADLRLGMRENGGKIMVDKMSVGVLNVVSWRYVCVDDALRYLQRFLLP